MTANAANDKASWDAICAGYDNRPEALIEILHDVQQSAGAISDDAMRAIAHALNISRAEVFGVMTFYDDFSQTPRPEGLVKLCRAEACQAVGADDLATACDANGIQHQTVYCLGNCALGPAALVGERLIGRADVARLGAAVRIARGEG